MIMFLFLGDFTIQNDLAGRQVDVVKDIKLWNDKDHSKWLKNLVFQPRWGN